MTPKAVNLHNYYITKYPPVPHRILVEHHKRKELMHPINFNYRLKKRHLGPLIISVGALLFRTALILYLNKRILCYPGTRTRSIIFLSIGQGDWWLDADKESQKGRHLSSIQENFKFIYIRFLISEFRLFVSFFWGFFASSLVAHTEIGQVWPPHGIIAVPPFTVPLLNTLILLTSAVTVTAGHKIRLKKAHKSRVIRYFVITILLSLSFTQLQIYEFQSSAFDVTDSVFGSTFFSLTGLHAFHVIRGTLLIRLSLRRIQAKTTRKNDHFFVESSLWYWHFVDVVWIALFIILYIWGGFGIEGQVFPTQEESKIRSHFDDIFYANEQALYLKKFVRGELPPVEQAFREAKWDKKDFRQYWDYKDIFLEEKSTDNT